MSAGMINEFDGKLSVNTKEERKRIFASLLQNPVLYTVTPYLEHINQRKEGVDVSLDF